MSAEQRHAENALAAIDELLELFPTAASLPPDHTAPGGWVFIAKKDARFARYNELSMDLNLSAERLGFDLGDSIVIERLPTSGPRIGGAGCFVQVERWKPKILAVRRAVQRELHSVQAATTINGVSLSDIDEMRKILKRNKRATAARVLGNAGGKRQISNLTLRVLAELGEFHGYSKKSTKQVALQVEAIITGLKISRAQRS